MRCIMKNLRHNKHNKHGPHEHGDSDHSSYEWRVETDNLEGGEFNVEYYNPATSAPANYHLWFSKKGYKHIADSSLYQKYLASPENKSEPDDPRYKRYMVSSEAVYTPDEIAKYNDELQKHLEKGELLNRHFHRKKLMDTHNRLSPNEVRTLKFKIDDLKTLFQQLASPIPSPAHENRPQINARNVQTSLEHSEYRKQESISDTYKRDPVSILDKSLSKIIDNTLNFTVRSFDEYYSRYSEAEAMVGDYREKRGILDSLKVHMYASVLFFKHGDNIMYIGILLIMVSLIIYFVNISTS